MRVKLLQIDLNSMIIVVSFIFALETSELFLRLNSLESTPNTFSRSRKIFFSYSAIDLFCIKPTMIERLFGERDLC